MLSIGPYVVVREIPTQHPGTPGGTGKTYRATDRLTGIPVLLHHLPTMTGVPELPAHPALLPFTDLVVHAGEAFLITELPPNAVPARESLSAARGALLALAALHEKGLAHGGINSAQLWSVDGPVRLAGGGRFELGGEYTVARDLRELAVTLDGIGGLPPILSLLRTEPERLSAREALELLQTGERPPAPPTVNAPEQRGVRFQANEPAQLTRQGGLPNLDPLSLLNPSAPLPQTPSFVSQAVWTSTQEPSSSNTDPGVSEQPQALPFKLDISQWDVPDFMHAEAPVAPVSPVAPDLKTVPERIVSLGWQDVNRPLQQHPTPEVTTTPDTTPPPPDENAVTRQGRKARAAASQALNRLRADGERQRQLQEVRRDEVVAQLAGGSAFPGVEPAHQLAAIASGENELPVTETETPQERRRREHQARLEEEKLAAQLVGSRPPTPPVVTPSASTGQGDAEQTALPARQLKGVKMRWDDRTKTWQKVTEVSASTPATRPAWLIPALAAAALLLALTAWGLSRRAPAAPATTTTPQTCCTVNFKVNGAGHAQISILNSTSQGNWKAGQVIGDVPGTLPLPGEGTYRLGVTSEGFSPATVEVKVPTREPVTINLGQ